MSTTPSPNIDENELNSPTKLSSELLSETDSSCWSPRFEFDAPRYTNFNSKKYQETRRRLNKLILGETEGDCETENNVEIDSKAPENLDDDIFISKSPQYSASDSSSEIDEWFSRFHPLHEPLRPMTPPGPLISPERRRLGVGLSCLIASPLKLETDSSFTQSPTQSKTAGPFVNTPSKGPNTRIGLRSKPARVLKSGAGVSSSSNSPSKSFINSSPSSLIRSTNFFQDTSTAVSPARSSVPFRDSALSPLRSMRGSEFSPIRSPIRAFSPVCSPIRAFPPASRTPQHSPSLSSTDSAISLNVSSLTKNGLVSPIKLPSSPLKMKSKFSEGTASPLRNSILFQPEMITRKRPPNPTETLSTNLTAGSTKIRKHPKIDAELEDIKKLLSQHNNRIRPNQHNNNNNNNKRKS